LLSLAVILTDQCNYDCAYCYEPRGKRRLDFPALLKAIDFFHPFMSRECFISFYGGEPLLAFNTLWRAVEHLEGLSTKRKIRMRYSLTTNGSLLNKDILGFLAEHEFSLTLSFDGLAQDLQRRKGSSEFLTSVIPQILARPRIAFETNSVFSSETVGYLSDSVQSIIRLGVPKLDVNFAHKPPWTPSSLLRLEEQMARLGEYFLSHYENLADIPWRSFCEERDKAVYYCSAGLNKMALSAQGTLWGCALFPHYFAEKKKSADYQKYCFGDVGSFIKDPQRIYAQKMINYSALRMDRFSTPSRSCLECGEIEQCWICPLAAALTTGEIGRIPGWSCRGAEILRKEKRLFLDRYRKKYQRNKPESSD
jgi:sulfatase maturation enzyme AslB (radical SAM superfamily)